MSAPGLSRPEVEIPEELASAWGRHDPWVLGVLAVLPRWMAELTGGLNQPADLHRFLDEAVPEGWVEASPVPGFLAGTLRLRLASTGDSPSLETPASPADDDPREATLALSTVELRSTGFRFRAGERWPTGRVGTAIFEWGTSPARDAGAQPEHVGFRCEILRCEGSEWSGYDVEGEFRRNSVKEHIAPSELLGPRLYAVASPRRTMRPLLLAHAVQALERSNRPWWTLGSEFRRLLESVPQLPADLDRCRQFLGWILNSSDGLGGIPQLDRQIRSHIEQGDESSGLAWMLMAESFLGLLGRPLQRVLELSERRLELSYRREVEERYLASFLERREQVEAFRRLMASEQGQPWALHYLGVGGVGKTMLVRYLLHRELRDIPCARVDFDFLKPEYPARRPGQLLLELADGLRIFSRGRSDEFFEKFRMEADNLHLQLDQIPVSADPLVILRDSRFAFMLELFADFLRQFNQPRVVLILDTCEELARLRVEGRFLPAVEATFEILHAIQQRCPFVRVVLAGRRLLGDAGAGWNAAGKDAPQNPRPFLSLHLIRGFDREEALRFLGTMKVPAPDSGRTPITGELAEAILSKSPEEAFRLAIQWDDPPRVGDETRYNPFELSMLADWYLGDETVTVAAIRDAVGDPYVEHRILGRLRHPRVLRAIPYLVLLPQVERTVLRSVLDDLEDEEFDLLYRELCQLEWLTYRVEDAGGGRYLRVQDGLRKRLGSCLHLERWEPEMRRARKRLEPLLVPALLSPLGWNAKAGNQETTTLPAEVLAAGLGKVDLEQLVATLALLPEAEALSLWGRFEQAFALAGDWKFALEVCRVVLAEEGRLPKTLRGWVGATKIAASLHADPGQVAGGAWAGVRGQIETTLFSRVPGGLLERMELGEIAELARAGISSEGGVFVRLRTVLATGLEISGDALNQIVASRLAAMEAVLELAESNRGFGAMLGDVPSQDFLDRSALAPDLRWGLEIAELRWAAVSSQARLGDASVPEAVPEPPVDLQASGGWLDWVPPSTLRNRLRLEVLRWPGHGERRRAVRRLADRWLGALLEPDAQAGVGEGRQGTNREMLVDADAERLAARCLQLRLADELVPGEELKRLEGLALGVGYRRAECAAHRMTPPLFVEVARGWLAVGLPEEAMRVLRQGEGAHTQLKDAIDWTHRTILEVVRRMRWKGEAQEIVRYRAATGVAEDEAVAWPVMRLVEGHPPFTLSNQGVTLDRWVMWWLCRELAAADSVPSIPEEIRKACRFLADLDPERVEMLLMMMELLRETGVPDAGIRKALEDEADRSRRREGEAGWKVGLLEHLLTVDLDRVRDEIEVLGKESKSSVLRGMAPPGMRQPPSLRAIVASGGAREIAEYALHLGELLALRQSPTGEMLLYLAVRLFERAGDGAGRLIASIQWAERARIEDATAAVEAVRAADLAFQRPAGDAWSEWNRRSDAVQTRLVEGAARRISPGIREAGAPSDGTPAQVAASAPAPAAAPASPAPPRSKGKFADRPPSDRGRGSVPVPSDSVTLSAGQSEAEPGFPWGRMGFVLVVGGVMTAGLIGLYWNGWRWFTGRESGSGLVASVGAVGMALASVVMDAVRTFLGHLRDGMRVTLKPVFEGKPTPNQGVETGARWKVNLRVGLSYGSPSAWIRTGAPVPAPGASLVWTRVPKAVDFQPSEGMPSEFYREFQKWPAWVRGLGLPLGLRVDGQAALPWESELVRGWLAAERPQFPFKVDLWLHVPFRPYRCQPTRTTGRKVQDVRSARHVFFVASPRHEVMLEEGWDRGGLKPGNTSDDWAQIEAKVEWVGEVRLVHFLGRPLETPTGLVLKVESRAEFRGAMSKGGTMSAASELLIVPGKQGLNRIPLLVVQGEPSEIGVITATDWVEMGKLRGFCGRLFDDGAMAVLMIPALPSALARSVVAELAGGIGQCQDLELKELLDLTQTVREHIATWTTPSGEQAGSGPTSDALIELSIAVTLFARHNFRHLPSDP